jgi:hypothetical protein
MNVALRARSSSSTLLVSLLLAAAAPAFAEQGAVSAQVSGTPAGWRVAGEVAGGFAGEAAMLLPGAYSGFLLGYAYTDGACGLIWGSNRPSSCVDRAGTWLWGANVGASLGVGLGSGLGVLVSGQLLHAKGNGWLALGAGLAGGALGLFLPLPQPAGFFASAGFAVIGSTLAYELTASAPGGVGVAVGPLSELHITPAITARGGLVSVGARF